jgi:hypothetical protein
VKIGLVACSKTKLPHPAPARELYQGTLFRLSRAYVERECGSSWFILSAKYGLVLPAQTLEPYNVFLGDLAAAARRAWAARVLAALEIRGLLSRANSWLVLAGKRYREFLVPILPGEVQVPLAGLGLGQQIAALKKLLEESNRG